MIDRALSAACWGGWAFLAFGLASIGWWVIMKW